MPIRLTNLVRAALLAALLFPLPRNLAAVDMSSRWFARPWQTEEGLPNSTVVGLVQTPDGYLWLGTPTGLARFDGVDFQEFPSTNFVTAPNRGVLTMIGSRDGGLCLAMDRGAIVLLKSNSFRAFMPGADLPDEFPFTLAEDGDGALWVSYRAGAVCRILAGRVTRFGAGDGLSGPPAMCALGCDRQGRLWFVRNGTFGVFRDGRFQSVHQFGPLPARLGMAQTGGLWICMGARLFRYEESGELKELGAFSDKPGDIEPTALLEDREGGVWIGTAYHGLFHFDGSVFEAVPTTHRQVNSLAEDREGNLWVGTTGGGLNRVRPRAVELEGAEAGLPFETVQSLCQDSTGMVWAVTQNGAIAWRTNGQWRVFNDELISNVEATCVSADPLGRVWIGTRMNGLYCWQDGKFVDWGDPKELEGRTIHTLQSSRSGDLWIGEETPNTVQRLHAGKLVTLRVPPEDLRVIRAMTEDANGTVWVGTSRGVLLRVSDNQLIDETPRVPGSPVSIRCLSATPDGSVWIGYAGGGLGRMKDGHFASIRSEQGLFDDYISHIVADEGGWLWFGGNLGIFKVRQRDLDDVAEGVATRVRSIHYGRGEGLPSLQGSFGGAPDVLRSRDGRLWIPMRTALAVINPGRLHENSRPPPVLLHRVIVDDHTVALYNGVVPSPRIMNGSVLDLRSERAPLRLPPGHRRIEFDFTALSLTPENVYFRYQLEGYDNDWSRPQLDRKAPYSRLGAGTYQFRVMACNSDGIWNEKGDSLSLVVAPFFWQTWTFRLFALGVFTLSLIALVRYVSFRHLRLEMRRLEQQAALHRERARIAKDIHDDVGANLTQIALLGELAQQDRAAPEQSSKHIGLISTTARQAIKSLDEIVWAVNPRNDTLAHLIDYTGQYAVDFLRLAGIRCRLDLPEHPPQREISTDLRHNLFLVVKEALNNVVKHAGSTEVWVRVHTSDRGVRIVVEDNGHGFEGPATSTGADGLNNMRQRIQDLGGECRIESSVGSGTTVTAELPWPEPPK